jgi:autotransporter-associated beta strand protein
LGADSTISVAGTQLTLSGIMSGTGYGITKTGSGTLILSGANTFTGAITISTGALRASNITALGTTAGGVTVASGAALELSGGITIGDEALSLNNDGISSGGALRNISGDNTYGGTITLATNAVRINSDSGTLTLNKSTTAITATNINLTFGGSGNTTVTTIIATGSGTLTKDGTGTLTLSGANTYTGATTVSAGTLAIGNATGLGTTAGGVTVASGATLDLVNVALGAEAITLNGGTLADATSSLAGNLTLGANSTLSVANAADTFEITGIVSGAYSITKTGSGVLVLSGANTYSGGTTVSGGTLKAGISSTGSVTNGPFGTGTVTVSSGYTLDLNGYSLANALNLSGTGLSTNGALINNSGSSTSTVSGAVTLAAATNIGGTGDITISGAITSGGFGLAFKNGGNHNLTSTTNTLSTVSATNISSLAVKNNADLTVGTVNSVSGISAVGNVTLDVTGAITIGGNLTTTASASSSNTGIQMLATKHVLFASGNYVITSGGGQVVLASSLSGNYVGGVVREYPNSGSTTITTNGGHLWIGGSSVTKDVNGQVTAIGYALGDNSNLSTAVLRLLLSPKA